MLLLQFYMMLMETLFVKQFCSFGAVLLIVNLSIKTDSNDICVPCMLEHVCYEPLIFLKNCRFGRYLALIGKTLCDV